MLEGTGLFPGGILSRWFLRSEGVNRGCSTVVANEESVTTMSEKSERFYRPRDEAKGTRPRTQGRVLKILHLTGGDGVGHFT